MAYTGDLDTTNFYNVSGRQFSYKLNELLLFILYRELMGTLDIYLGGYFRQFYSIIGG
jgi:hypothetical protein